MTFNLLQPTYPLSPEEHTAMVVFMSAGGPESDVPMFVASLRFEKQLREMTHFYHGVGLDIDNNKRWYVMPHMGGAHSSTKGDEVWYGDHGADPDTPLAEDVRKEAEDYAFREMRTDFFYTLGLGNFIG